MVMTTIIEYIHTEKQTTKDPRLKFQQLIY